MPSCSSIFREAIENAGRILKETRCQAVKLEGGMEQAEVIEALASSGIPVMAHVGLRPQNVHRLGGYSIQRDREELLADAKAAESSGAFAIVLECIPAEIADEITEELSIPTIGIGAGAGCDGQILVMHDLLGLSDHTPRFVQNFMSGQPTIKAGLKAFVDAVKDGEYPSDEESYADAP